MENHFSWRRVTLLVSFGVLLGCGHGNADKGIVRGQVLFAGKPVNDGTIRFEDAAGVSENADLDAEGKYQVRSHLGAGLPAGVYRVAVLPRVVITTETPPLAGAAPPDDPSQEFPHIPSKFRDTETSELKIEVRVGDNPSFDFDLSK